MKVGRVSNFKTISKVCNLVGEKFSSKRSVDDIDCNLDKPAKNFPPIFQVGLFFC